MTGRAIKSDIEKFQPTPFAGMEWREKNANRLAIRIDRNFKFARSLVLTFTVFFKNGPNPDLFVYFRSFHKCNDKYSKIRIRDYK